MAKEGIVRDVTDMGMGGVSAMFATMFTNPIEVVKTRLQLQGELVQRGRQKPDFIYAPEILPPLLMFVVKNEKTNLNQHLAGLVVYGSNYLVTQIFYKNVPHGMFVIAKEEGFRSLQRGLPAMLGFQFCLNTFRLGVYRISERRGLTTEESGRTSVVKGAVAAGVGGALGSIAGTPFFLVKTRLQSQAVQAIAVGHQHQHTGMVAALREIYGKEGVKGLFRGVHPQIPRGAVGSSSQMVSFAFAKEFLRDRNIFADHPIVLSFLGANLGGLVMTVCLNPFDVVATRLSNQAVDAQNRGKLYNGMADCFVKMVRTEGFYSLYKGTTANYLRLGPHTVLLLVCWDQLKVLEEFMRK